MKLLMTADAVGGVWQYSLDLARGLARHGIHVVLATMGPRPTIVQRAQASQVSSLRLVESDFALEWMQDPWRDVDQAGAWLRRLASEHAVDLVHLNGYAHAAPEWGLPVISVAHSCVSSWWRAVHREAPGREWGEYRERVSAGLAACDMVVAPTAFMARALRQEYCFSGHRVCVIPNFSRAPRKERGPKRQTCLAAGRLWDVAKNLQVLNRAAEVVEWPICVAGSPIDPQTGIPVETSLHALGSLQHSQLLKHMRHASLFVHPALYEPFGLGVLEAARSRCCLVLSDIESMCELWEGAAVFVDPRDPEAWAAEIEGLTRAHFRREHLASLALERSASYSAFASITAYSALYRSLLTIERPAGAAA